MGRSSPPSAPVLTGTYDHEEVTKLVAERDAEFAKAKEATTVANIAVVESTHLFGPQIGYDTGALVVVATNPQMAVMARNAEGKFVPTGEKYRKHTVCRYNEHAPVDLPAVLAELVALEPGWGGRDNIIGSPQNVSSTLTTAEVVAIVAKHIK